MFLEGTLAIDKIQGQHLRTIIFYTNQMLRTIVLCYQDFESWLPTGVPFHSAGEIPDKEISHDMILVTAIGIEDPLHPGAHDVITKYYKASITIKMYTGENTPDHLLNRHSVQYLPCWGYCCGRPFPLCSQSPRVRRGYPCLWVLTQSSLGDNRVLVQTLRGLGGIVGITGGCANDGTTLNVVIITFVSAVTLGEGSGGSSGQNFPTYLGHTPTYYLFPVWHSTYHLLFTSATFVTYFHLIPYFFCHLSRPNRPGILLNTYCPLMVLFFHFFPPFLTFFDQISNSDIH